MIRQSSSRNQRSKGVGVKHVLQICMLLAVCCWLIYQVKHTYDKRKHFEENDAEISRDKLQKFDEVIKLGRKDLHPRDEELTNYHEKIGDEEVEDEETLEKGDETFDELEKKHQEEGSADIEALLDGTSRDEEAGGRAGDDDIDEHDFDKAEKELDVDEDVIGGDKDVEKDEEIEIDEKEGDEDIEHHKENDGSSDDQDHDNSRDRHEAREEQYNADDASSAVAHIGQNILTENPEHRNLSTDLSNENNVAKDQSFNDTVVLENSKDATPPRLVEVLDKNDSNESSGEAANSTPPYEGHIIEVTPEQNSSAKGLTDDKISNTVNRTKYIPSFTSNTTDVHVELDDNSNSTLSRGISTSGLAIGFNVTTNITTNQTESSNEDEHEDAIQDKKDAEEDSILSSLNDEETVRDPLISEEDDKEKDSLIDLDTLPELGTGSDDAATE